MYVVLLKNRRCQKKWPPLAKCMRSPHRRLAKKMWPPSKSPPINNELSLTIIFGTGKSQFIQKVLLLKYWNFPWAMSRRRYLKKYSSDNKTDHRFGFSMKKYIKKKYSKIFMGVCFCTFATRLTHPFFTYDLSPPHSRAIINIAHGDWEHRESLSIGPYRYGRMRW